MNVLHGCRPCATLDVRGVVARDVSPKLVKKLARLADAPEDACIRLLADLAPDAQARFVSSVEARDDEMLHDPQEDDPKLIDVFASLWPDVERILKAEQAMRIDELRQTSPAVAELFKSGRGSVHRYWSIAEQLLRERHKLEWRSPADLNPWIRFD